jgi:hypothetical protein
MRFVIGNLVVVEEASPATAPEILLDALMMMMFRVVVPRSGEDDVASREVLPSVKNQGNRTRRRFLQHHVISPYTQENKSPHPTRPRGCQALDDKMKDQT